MSKTIRLTDDVYSALKSLSEEQGKTLSATVCALMHTADDCSTTEKRLSSLELQIQELKSLFLKNENQKAPQCPYFIKAPPKTNGLGRIRTGDLRHVKATS